MKPRSIINLLAIASFGLTIISAYAECNSTAWGPPDTVVQNGDTRAVMHTCASCYACLDPEGNVEECGTQCVATGKKGYGLAVYAKDENENWECILLTNECDEYESTSEGC